jgi:hypothetical protein
MYYVKGANHTYLSRISTNYIGEYNIDYQVICPNFGFKSTVTVNFKIVDKVPPFFDNVPIITMEVGSKIPDPKVGLVVSDNYYSKDQITININDKAVNTSVVGVYNLEYLAVDPSSNVSTYTTKVYVVDTVPPEITQKKALEIEVNTTLKITDFFTFKDTYSNVLTNKVIDNLVDYNNVGIYPISLEVYDGSMNVSCLDVLLKIQDTTPPKITLKTYVKPISVYEDITRDLLESYILSVIDNYTPLSISDCIINYDIENQIVGQYNINYKIYDSSNNITETTLKVNVVDNIAPQVNTLFELIFEVNCQPIFIEDYLLIDDNYCKYSDLTIKIDSKYNLSVVGRYLLEVVVTDSYKNTTKYHDYINVVDTTPPIITLDSDIIIIDFLKKSFIGYFSLTDNYSKPEKIVLVVDDSLCNYESIGIYKIIAYAIDENLNKGSLETNIYIMDVLPPSLLLSTDKVYIELNGDDNLNLSSYILSVSDNIDILTPDLVEITSNINFTKIGSYIAYYSIIDSSYNETIKTLTIYVDDTTPPFVRAYDLIYKTNDSFTLFDSIFVEDESEYNIICLPSEIDKNVPGIKELLYVVSDSRGNISKVTRTITIKGDSKQEIKAKDYLPLGLVILGSLISIGVIVFLERR